MLYGLLITCFVIICFFLIILILIQKSKGGMGVGAFGGSSQLLFGGSGGQDLMQKITWALVALLMVSSLVLSLMKSVSYRKSRFLKENVPNVYVPASTPVTTEQ